MLNTVRSLFIRSMKIGCASFVTANYLTGFVICKGLSMEPTIQTGNIFVIDQLSPRLGLIEIGDVVIAKSPKDDNVRVCKRVAAKDGDIVLYNKALYQVPKGHVWLLGDNRSNSKDSRVYGPVPVEDIRSRCWFRIWPDINRSILQAPPRDPKYSSPDDEQRNSLQNWFK